ncbi:MAG: cytochrome c oxidase assembly protein, partial [Pseudomonadota bacterium]
MKSSSNSRVAFYCVGLVGFMIGAAYAAVPLYDLFCRVTGYGGTTQVADAPSGEIADREITIRFDANVAGGLGWDFRPEVRTVTLKMGEVARMDYIAANLGIDTSVGTSTFNVTPGQAGAYFNKMACFCFQEQALTS